MSRYIYQIKEYEKWKRVTLADFEYLLRCLTPYWADAASIIRNEPKADGYSISKKSKLKFRAIYDIEKRGAK